jgi:hypothetical protein
MFEHLQGRRDFQDHRLLIVGSEGRLVTEVVGIFGFGIDRIESNRITRNRPDRFRSGTFAEWFRRP